MNTTHSDSGASAGPETTGLTLHHPGHYDLFSRLIGLGVNQSNSKMVVELAGVQPGDRVLDGACGTGNLTLTAKTYAGSAGSVTGIDASPEMIEGARRNAVRTGIQADFEIAIVEKMDFPAASFDVVISRLAIHHLPDDVKRRAFAEFFRVLKPGGRLFIVDFKRPSSSLLSHLALIFVGHRMLQTEMTVLPAMVKEAGFVDVASGPTPSAFLGFVRGRKPAR